MQLESYMTENLGSQNEMVICSDSKAAKFVSANIEKVVWTYKIRQRNCVVYSRKRTNKVPANL